MEIIVGTNPLDSCYSTENGILGVCVRNGPWTLKKKENQHAKIAKWAKSSLFRRDFYSFQREESIGKL